MPSLPFWVVFQAFPLNISSVLSEYSLVVVIIPFTSYKIFHQFPETRDNMKEIGRKMWKFSYWAGCWFTLNLENKAVWVDQSFSEIDSQMLILKVEKVESFNESLASWRKSSQHLKDGRKVPFLVFAT